MDRTRRLVVAAGYIAAVSAVIGAAAFWGSRSLVAKTAQLLAVAQAEPPIYLGALPSSPSRPLSLFVAGDVMLDRTVATRISNSGNDQYPFLKVMSDPRFTLPDLRLINLEGPVTARRAPPEKEIDFQFNPKFAKVLAQIGINAVSQANNHALDQGRPGAEESHRLLTAAGLTVFGDEVREDVNSFARMEVRGRSIAFVGFNETSDAFDEESAAEAMQLARASGRTVLVFMHWGEEYQSRPNPKQEKRARWLIDNGADIVIGAHPHWVESVSLYKGRPIVYSLGNFVFDQDWSAETRRGLALGLSIDDEGVRMQLYPVQIDQSQPRFVEGEERTSRLRDLASISDASLMPQILQGEVLFPHALAPSL